ncbi:hypothetical protein X749_26155 [Mesorhizobium sp. LNJC391B00]|nr:hypothetical protein X749_26155 [Mesorhizobium sp. LNJC391B00]
MNLPVQVNPPFQNTLPFRMNLLSGYAKLIR